MPTQPCRILSCEYSYWVVTRQGLVWTLVFFGRLEYIWSKTLLLYTEGVPALLLPMAEGRIAPGGSPCEKSLKEGETLNGVSRVDNIQTPICLLLPSNCGKTVPGIHQIRSGSQVEIAASQFWCPKVSFGQGWDWVAAAEANGEVYVLFAMWLVRALVAQKLV